MTKRLFLFAGFDKDNIIDNTLIYYINELSRFGDIVFVADNNLPHNEIKKISNIPNVLHAESTKHNEYDFGSYKRAYLWAKNNKILNNYDWFYFVNDSVYGPLYDIKLILEKLEKSGTDLTGMVSSHDDCTPIHAQSWFVGITKKVLKSTFFDKFITNVKKLEKKNRICLKYEVGLSNLILRHGFEMKTIIDTTGDTVYRDPRYALINGVPFIKKNAIANIRKMYFLYSYVDDDKILDYIDSHMKRHNMGFIKDDYHLYYEFRFLKIPIVRITSKNNKSFRVYIFGKLPIIKIIRQ